MSEHLTGLELEVLTMTRRRLQLLQDIRELEGERFAAREANDAVAHAVADATIALAEKHVRELAAAVERRLRPHEG